MMNQRIQISQQSETEIRQVSRSVWEYEYGYSRSAESRNAGDSGQDYITFLEGEGYMLFVICDGISQSYFGEWAAKFLGDHLMDWLQNLNIGDWDEALLQRSLDRYLTNITVIATESLKLHQIPPHIHGMLRDVLSAKKDKGSGAVYGCGRIDLPNDDFPEGRLVLAWQGDIRLRLWSDQMEVTAKLGDRFHTFHQWNSAKGPVGGMPYVYCDSLRIGGTRGALLLYSDGLNALDPIEHISKDLLLLLLKAEAEEASSDDLSVFHLCWNYNLPR